VHEPPRTGVASGGTSALPRVFLGFSRLILTGPRRWMWRRTIGRFRSEEAVYKSAERQYQTLAETLDGQVHLTPGS